MGVEYLVTGGAGFIGSNLTEELLARGRSVRIFDNFLTGKRANIARFGDRVEVCEGDLRNPDQVRAAVAGARYVIHMGALPSVPRSVAEPQLAHDININGTVQVLLAARDAGCERVVFSSSSAVYGETPTLPKQEAMAPAPVSPYGLHKLTGEYYANLFWNLYQLPTVALRYFNVFGPRQDPQSQYAAVIPRFITSILGGESPTIYGDGQQSRDFSHVRNVIEANIAACVAPQPAWGKACNIACGGRISLLELVALINQIVGADVAPRFEPARAGDIKHSQADIARAAELLNWTPPVSFEAGLRLAVEWYREALTAAAR